MKLSNYLYLVTNKILRRKGSSIANMILLVITIGMLITTIGLSNFIFAFNQSNYNSNYTYRKLFVQYDYNQLTEKEAITAISNLSNIGLVTPQSDMATSVSTDLLGTKYSSQFISLVGCNEKTTPQVIKGKAISNNSKNEIIVPKKFSLKDDKGNYLPIINGETLIGTKIKLNYKINDFTSHAVKNGDENLGEQDLGQKEAEFSVIGVYDSDEYFEYNDSCYVQINDITNFSLQDIKDTAGFSPLVVIVDNYENINKVINQLHEIKMVAQEAVQINNSAINFTLAIGYIISAIFFIISLFSISLNMKMDLKKCTKEYGLLKAIGYKDKQLAILIFLEQIIISVFAYIIAAIISIFSLGALSKAFLVGVDNYGKVKMHLTFTAMFFSLLVCFVIPSIILILYNAKLKKISPINAGKIQ